MPKKSYFFPYVKSGTTFYHYVLTSKTLLQRLGDVEEAFARFADDSISRSPKYILYLMLQHNETLLGLSEYARAPDSESTLPTVKSSPESPSPERRHQKPRSLKRRRSSLSDSTPSGSESSEASSSRQEVFASPRRKRSSTISIASDLGPIPEESNPSASDLEQKPSFDETATSLVTESSSSCLMDVDIPPNKDDSTFPEPTDLVPASQVQPQESTSKDTSSHSTSVREISSPVKEPKKDINPTCIQEDIDPSDKTEISEKTDSKSSQQEFKVPEIPVKDKKDTSTTDKLTDTAPASQLLSQEPTSTEISNLITAVKKPLSPIEEPQKDINPTTCVQDVNPSDEAVMEMEADSGSSLKEFKVPAIPVKYQKGTSTFSKPADPVPTSQESKNAKSSSPIKELEKDVNPTTCVQDVNLSDKAKMDTKTDSSPGKEFKIPELPVKHRKEVSKPAKRPAESSLSPSPEIVSTTKKTKTEDEMDVSPGRSPPAKRPTHLSLSPRPEFSSPSKKDKSIKPIPLPSLEWMSPKKGARTSKTSSKEGTSTAVSKKNESATQTTPIKDDGIEIDMVSASDDKPGPSNRLTSAEIENLIDDPSRVESIREAVKERIKVSISPKKAKKDFSSPEKKSCRRSPRKSRKIGSPGKDAKSTIQPDPEKISSEILSHPNVMVYLKLKFKSILTNRNNYMKQIYNYFLLFYSDVNFLFYYSSCVFSMARDIPVEGQVYFSRDVRNLKRKLMRDARELENHLRPFSNASNVDIPFWRRSLNEVQRLNRENECLLSSEGNIQTTVESLRKYESKLRVIWKRMDHRVLVADGTRLSLLEISADFKKLTKDFARYLLMIELMKPTSLALPNERRMRISWF